ncbi:putative toxin-antitoxin system toxin component, PIN family [Candidatus Aerophobetes bacterium]|uniref:Putative toxin-antitoxin system toxin component, PIN family n=1 Tax=Aerophobetes bacterium TaxID=2030807 RepID=A0A523RUK3_UNCAE|nr:MAG: putative toxin-antitoxin system toxin component, PIN family [Candidatus Aerophobetes bacterium]
MKIVLDTNVLISALFWHGLPHKLLRLIEKGTFTLCITTVLLEELRDVLSRPFFLSRIKERKTSCEELLAAILDMAELYPDKKIDSVIKNDPDDDKVLSCALVSGAKYIITGDPHLLKLKNWSDISILTPHQFLNLIK